MQPGWLGAQQRTRVIDRSPLGAHLQSTPQRRLPGGAVHSSVVAVGAGGLACLMVADTPHRP
jgi:hypothetical protein